MSYEGFELHLCEDGHAWQCDAYDEDKTCADCGKPAISTKSFDCTNGCDDCKINYSEDYKCGLAALTVKTPAEYETCNLGHRHMVKAATYEFGEEP